MPYTVVLDCARPAKVSGEGPGRHPQPGRALGPGQVALDIIILK